MNEHYLDALGNGYMAFSLTKKDGGKEKDLAFGTNLEAYYTDTQKNISKEFVSYDIEPVYSKQQNSLDGIQLSFYGTQFPADGGEILIKIGKESFTFPDIKVTQPHYYEWKSPEGSVFLSNVGLIADGDTKTCMYIGSTIGTDKDTEKIANVVYKDGQQESLQLSYFCGVEDNSANRAVIQFSPWTELQKHLREGRSWEEVEDEWERNFSIYTFKLDEISTIQIGDIVLDAKKAIYH